MILAAGRGERLRPLTDTIPKPMVKRAGSELLLWHVLRLRHVGIRDIVVNSAWLSHKIVDFLGDGSKWGVKIVHSVEGPEGLETAGGIIQTLDYFGSDPFLVVNGDTYLDADYTQFLQEDLEDGDALLFMINNPRHNPNGDFALRSDGHLQKGHDYTFSGAAVYTPQIFAGLGKGKRALRPVFDNLIEEGRLFGKLLQGTWFDVGTMQRLQEATAYAVLHNKNAFDLEIWE